jgi:magnesium chelatase family protein
MIAKVNSISLIGLDGVKVEVQVDVNYGLFEFNIVGMADREVIEAKKRVISAIKNSGYTMPMQRIIINLAPADIAKTSTGFDFPIAVAILLATKQIDNIMANEIYWGELALDGSLESTRGSLGIVLAGSKIKGIDKVYLPEKDAKNTSVVKSIDSIPIKNLKDLKHKNTIKKSREGEKTILKHSQLEDLWILNNPSIIRIMQICAIGRHNLLLIGPPGVGKSFFSKLISYFLPDINQEECIEISKIYSIAGLLNNGIIDSQPIRSPHHSITKAAFIGGGVKFKPGEISLAHKGVLFLDEFNMFAKEIIEMLRQPLEEKKIVLSRGAYSYILPADFILIGAINPCKCGNYGSRDSICDCTDIQRRQYWNRISKPILDRIDLQIYVPNRIDQMIGRSTSTNKVINLNSLREHIMKVDTFRKARIEKEKILNAGRVDKLEFFDDDAKELIINAVDKLNINIRGYYKILSIARTIADLEYSSRVNRAHVAEAFTYRFSNTL